MAVNIEALRKMGTSDLRELNSAIVAEINERNRNRQRDLVRQFRTGDKAAFKCSRTGRMVNVRVDRLNTKTIGCTELNSDGSLTMKTWRVSPGLLVSVAA